MGNDRELTIGERAVGLTFNPSNDSNVQFIKESFAQTIDMIDKGCNLEDPINRKIRDCAIENLITAQMWAVKAITWNK